MKTMAKGILAKVLGAGLLAGAVGLAVPAAQAQQYGYGTYDRYNNGSSNSYNNNGYHANSYDRYDRFCDHDDGKRHQDWGRHEARERRRYEREQRERMKHGYDGYGWH